jgi:hypothetical protein
MHLGGTSPCRAGARCPSGALDDPLRELQLPCGVQALCATEWEDCIPRAPDGGQRRGDYCSDLPYAGFLLPAGVVRPAIVTFVSMVAFSPAPPGGQPVDPVGDAEDEVRCHPESDDEAEPDCGTDLAGLTRGVLVGAGVVSGGPADHPDEEDNLDKEEEDQECMGLEEMQEPHRNFLCGSRNSCRAPHSPCDAPEDLQLRSLSPHSQDKEISEPEPSGPLSPSQPPTESGEVLGGAKPTAALLSDTGMPLKQIARLVGHAGTNVTETVYRHQIRPVIEDGATAMDQLLPGSHGER